MTRPSFDETFLAVAQVMAERSTCRRRKVGAVIVSARNHILSTGYNGVPSGAPHCVGGSEGCGGHMAASGQDLDLCQALHAEQNAIARLIEPFAAHTLYCTTAPCMSCTKLIAATGVQRIVCCVPYPKSGKEFWLSLGRTWDELEY